MTKAKQKKKALTQGLTDLPKPNKEEGEVVTDTVNNFSATKREEKNTLKTFLVTQLSFIESVKIRLDEIDARYEADKLQFKKAYKKDREGILEELDELVGVVDELDQALEDISWLDPEE